MTSRTTERPLVIVGVDGSAQSVAALRWAARYAAATGAIVRAMLTWHYPSAAAQPPVGQVPLPVREETEAAMRQVLREAVAEAFPGAAADAVETELAYGHPAQALIDASKQADLLVVGSSGHGAFTGMLAGSVSIHCVTGAHCPVTVVRGPGSAGEES